MVFIFAENNSSFSRYVSEDGGSFTYKYPPIVVPTANGMCGNNGAASSTLGKWGAPYCLVDDGRGIVVYDGDVGEYPSVYPAICIVNKDFTPSGVSFYVKSYVTASSNPYSSIDARNATYQFNVSSITYYYTAVG